MEPVQLNFRYTETEYLAAIRLYMWNTSELLLGWVTLYVAETTSKIMLILKIM